MTYEEMSPELREEVEKARATWANVAKKNDWYTEPFYIQVWVNESDDLLDAVAFKGMTADIIVESDGDFD